MPLREEENIYTPFVNRQTQANILTHDVRVLNVMVYRHKRLQVPRICYNDVHIQVAGFPVSYNSQPLESEYCHKKAKLGIILDQINLGVCILLSISRFKTIASWFPAKKYMPTTI